MAFAALGIVHLSTGLRGLPGTYTMTGPSMEPSVGRGDWFLTRPAPPVLRRGMLVIMAFEDGTEEHRVLRRLVALPGDTVLMSRGTLAVNGRDPGWPGRTIEPRAERGLEGPVRGTVYSWGPVVVGPDSVFVLSDLRDMQGWPDSRFLGAIPRRLVGEAYVVTLWRAGQ